MSGYYQQWFTAQDGGKVARVSVLGADPVRAHLWRVAAFGTEYLGGHEAGEDFASPPDVRAGEALVVQYGPADTASVVYLEALRDEEWHERQRREAERARGEAQDVAADAAIWWAGCPS